MQRNQEYNYLRSRLESSKKDLPVEQVEYVQQLVNVLAKETQSDRSAESLHYHEAHRSVGAIEQDEYMPHVKRWLEN